MSIWPLLLVALVPVVALLPVLVMQHLIIRRLDDQNNRQAEMLMNYGTYGRGEKPTATVYDPGPVDDETMAQVEMHSRAVDRATEYLMDEGQVSKDRARAEAEILIANFESRGQPE